MSDPASSVRCLADLQMLVAGGGCVEYVFFWGHQPRPDGTVGAVCLSQWWPAPFVVDGIRYATAEHFMMVGKARLFGDEASAARMLAAAGPAVVKELGRRVAGFDQQV